MELLVAASVSAVVLTASWAWLWECGGASFRVQRDAQAATSAAYALRAVAADVGVATEVVAPPAPLAPADALCLRERSDGGIETVLIAWDGGRHVLWRKAPSTYLADSVRRFVVTYYRADGEALDASNMADPSWPAAVARVSIALEVGDGTSVVRMSRDVDLPAA